MISARKAWKMAMCDKCDNEAVKKALFSIEFKIKTHAKNGETNLKTELGAYIPKTQRYATYAKILQTLRRKGYKVNIQAETEYGIRFAYRLFGKHDKPMLSMLSYGTYLYISWEKK